jgi:hypothetical protein
MRLQQGSLWNQSGKSLELQINDLATSVKTALLHAAPVGSRGPSGSLSAHPPLGSTILLSLFGYERVPLLK